MANKVNLFIKGVRWPNLLFIALTQYLLHQYFLKQTLAANSLDPILNGYGFWALCLSTMCLAGGANLINDYFDIDTDRINRPEKAVIGVTISKKAVLRWYACTQIVGMIAAAYVTYISGRWSDFWILPGSIAGLYYYSYKAKSVPVLGNILVAGFCAVVILIVYYAEYPAIQLLIAKNYISGKLIQNAFLWFGLLAFLSNWWREITKDIEDLAGDSAQHIQTFVVKYGVRASKIYGGLIGIVLFIFSLYFFIYNITFSYLTLILWL
ncbi:MAG: geranylgeranylglycerol-phosphate geranylgeranyltransferase, partial [Saprospiraceae bacterium]